MLDRPTAPRRGAAHFVWFALGALLVCTTLGCASSGRPPIGRVVATFQAFAPRPIGQVGEDRFLGDLSTEDSQAQTTAATALAPGEPLHARFAEESLTNEGAHGSYLARFDGPLCPDVIGEPRTGAAALVVERKTGSGWSRIEGSTTWRSDRLLAFEATEPWDTATRYRIAGPRTPCAEATIEEPAAPRDDTRWRRELVHLPLEVTINGRPDGRIPANAPITLFVNQPVDTAALRAALSVRAKPWGDAAGEAEASLLPVKLSSIDRERGHRTPLTFEVQPAARSGLWPDQVHLTVTVAGTLQPQHGPEPLGADVVHRRGVGAPLHATPTCEADCDPGESIDIRTTRALAPKEAKRVRISPRPAGLDISSHPRATQVASDLGGGIVIAGVLKPNTRYRVTLPKGLRDDEGGALAQTEVIEVQMGQIEPVFGFDHLYDEDEDEDDDDGPTPPSWNDDWYEVRSSYWGVDILEASRPMTVGVFGRRIEAYEVRVAAIEPAQIPTWLESHRIDELPWPSATEVARAHRAMRARGPTQFDSQAVDLAQLVGPARGLFVVEVEATKVRGAANVEDFDLSPERRLVLLTDLSPTVAESTTRTTVRVRGLGDDVPVPGAKVRVVLPREVPGDFAEDAKAGRSPNVEIVELGVTDSRGELAVRSRVPEVNATPYLLVDAPNGDASVVELYGPGRHGLPRGDDAITRLGERVQGKLVAERGIYRPGETVHVMGWSSIASPYSPVRLRSMPEGSVVRVTLGHERLGEIAFTDVKTGPHGKFTTDFELSPELGAGRLQLDAVFLGGEGGIRGDRPKVEDFRTPTFWVRASARDDHIVASAHAYSGGAVPVIDVAYTHECHYARPSPRDYGLGYEWSVGEDRAGEASHALQVSVPSGPSLDAPATDGEVRLDLAFDEVPPATSLRCRVDVGLTDTSLQAYGDQAHPDRTGPGAVVALESEGTWDHAGPHEVTLRAVEVGGERVAMDKVTVRVLERTYDETKTPKEVMRPCEVSISAEGDDTVCRIPQLDPGGYVLEATTPEGIRTTHAVYAAWYGRDRAAPPPEEDAKSEEVCEKTAGGTQCRQVTSDVGFASPNRPIKLSVHPEVDHVQVGQRLRVAVRGPWSGAAGTLLVGEGGHLGRHDFELRKGRAVVDLLVDERWVGGVKFYAWVPRRGKSRLPLLEAASAHIEVSEASRTLDVNIDVAARAEAGEEVEVDVRVLDRDDGPAPRGRVSLWMVDEAVLDLTHYHAPNVAWALGPSAEEESDTSAYDDMVTAPFVPRRRDPGSGWETIGLGSAGGFGSGYGSGAGGVGTRARSPQERVTRDRFATTPLFVADLELDAEGRATRKVRLPGNLTRFRLMAVATAALPAGALSDLPPEAATDAAKVPGSFGVGSARLEVDLPFSVRLAMPRHLRPNDRAKVGGILVNRGGRARTVEVTASVDGGALTLVGSPVRTVEVPAEGRARVDFDVAAGADGESKVRLEVREVGGEAPIDAEVRTLPIRHERLREHRDTFSGVLRPSDRGSRTVKIPIDVPPYVDPEQVDVEVALATSQLLELGPTLASLEQYPYGCTEQTASAMLPGIAAAGPSLRELYPETAGVGFVEAGILKLAARQKTDGSFGYWTASSWSYSWASLHATWVLALADEAGFEVPDEVLERAITHVRAVASKPPEPDEFEWERETRRFAAWILADIGAVHRGNEEEDAAIDAVLRRHAAAIEVNSHSSVESRALVAYALHRALPDAATVESLMAGLRRDLTLTNGRAFVHPHSVDVSLGDTFRSAARATALVLIAVLEIAPDDPLADALARGLLEQRFAGTWGNTQANAFALLALERWAAKREPERVELATEVWLTRRRLMDETLRGPSVKVTREEGRLRVPAEKGRSALTLRVSGEGVAYFETTLERLRSIDERPADRGLHVEATLRDAAGPVAGQAPAGALLALDIEVTADTATRFVVADVPIPAGLELVRTDLGNQMRRMPIDGEQGAWVSHVERGMDRAIVYGDDLSPGRHRTTLFVRATAEGAYRWPGARAQAMYDPAVEGWSASRSFVVTAP